MQWQPSNNAIMAVIKDHDQSAQRAKHARDGRHRQRGTFTNQQRFCPINVKNEPICAIHSFLLLLPQKP
jgi:hypothetical protein